MIINSIENKIYPSYEDALSYSGGGGYSDDTLASVVVQKNLKFRELNQPPYFDITAVRTLIGVGLALNNKKKLRVLDFGGGGGNHFTIARAALPSDIELRWNVVESSALCRASSPLATKELQFYDEIEAASTDLGTVDLILTSSALQYVPNPKKTLDSLLKIKARNLFITRTPLSEHNEPIICVQKSRLADNGPGPLPPEYKDQEVLYPITYVPISDVENIINIYGQIRIKLKEDQGDLIYGGAKLNCFYGFFCDLKTAE
jgi:putative methyltransferase (TIGR04325 family)